MLMAQAPLPTEPPGHQILLKFGTRDLSTPLVHQLSADCFILPVQDEDGLILSLPKTYGAASNTGKEQVLPIFQLECSCHPEISEPSLGLAMTMGELGRGRIHGQD